MRCCYLTLHSPWWGGLLFSFSCSVLIVLCSPAKAKAGQGKTVLLWIPVCLTGPWWTRPPLNPTAASHCFLLNNEQPGHSCCSSPHSPAPLLFHWLPLPLLHPWPPTLGHALLPKESTPSPSCVRVCAQNHVQFTALQGWGWVGMEGRGGDLCCVSYNRKLGFIMPEVICGDECCSQIGSACFKSLPVFPAPQICAPTSSSGRLLKLYSGNIASRSSIS